MLRGSFGASISIGEAVTDKPSSAAGYDAEYTRLVRATCLYVATKLGDFLDDLSVDDVASRLQPLLGDPAADEAIRILKRDFREHDGVGPSRVAEFIFDAPDDEIQADVVGFIWQLLARCT